MSHLLFINPNTAGTAFVWFLLVGFFYTAGRIIYLHNKQNRLTIKK